MLRTAHITSLHATFRYVRNLERKVREMDRRTASNSTVLSPVEVTLSVNDDHASIHFPSQMPSASDSGSPGLGYQVAREAVKSPASSSLQQHPSTFAEELTSLSLEATAERNLGSTSGVSFAKLTQLVLRRLSPDKVDFVFANDHEEIDRSGLFNINLPSELADHTLFEKLNDSVSIHPRLFGDFTLAGVVQPDDTTAGSDLLLDEAHVNRLVEFYFAHSHTLYPIIHRGEFLNNLQVFRQSPQDPVSQSPLSMFRLWMVLAIGSTAYSAISLTEESESRMYYNEALRYLEQAMLGDMVRAIEMTFR